MATPVQAADLSWVAPNRICDNELDWWAVRWSGPEAEVGEDLLDHVGVRDEGDDEAGKK